MCCFEHVEFDVMCQTKGNKICSFSSYQLADFVVQSVCVVCIGSPYYFLLAKYV